MDRMAEPAQTSTSTGSLLLGGVEALNPRGEAEGTEEAAGRERLRDGSGAGGERKQEPQLSLGQRWIHKPIAFGWAMESPALGDD